MQLLLELEDNVEVPHYATEGAAGADLRAHLTESVTLQPGEYKLIPTGIRMEIPAGYEVQVRPRSGLAFKHGVTVLNSPGTIDSDYRGDLGVLLINHGAEPFVIEPGMRIAQIVVAQVVQAQFRESELAASARGSGGFGHTGVQ
jgi:dUTP diphosphatase